jgi:hypothetical protein
MGGLLVFLAYAFTLFLRGGSLFAGDGDPGRHIRVGRFILENVDIPRVDIFSHTMRGREFIPFEWLSEVIFAGAHALAGMAGVAILTAVLFAASVGLVYLTIHRAGVPSPVAFGFGFLGLVLLSVHLHPRPHMFTTLLVAVFNLVLLEVQGGGARKALLLLPPLMAAWVNLHGGFLVGFILLGVFVADSAIRWIRRPDAGADRSLLIWLLGTLVACLAVSLLNPAGWELWPHTTGYLRETYLVDFTQEYKSPDFHDALLKSFLLTLMAGTFVLGLLRSRIDLLGLSLWVLFAAFALHSTRNIPLFAVVCVPWLASWTCELLGQDAGSSGPAAGFWRWTASMQRVDEMIHGWPFALAGFLVLTQVALRPDTRARFAFSRDVFPVAAVTQLQESGFVPPGPVYNEFIWGGYLLYAWPEIPVYIDGQTDFYGEDLTREYRDIRFIQPGWRERLQERGVRWVMVPPEAPLAGALEFLPDWKLLYADATAVVWLRTDP